MNPQLDPQAIALSKAIREAEGFKGDWNQKGGSGEWGAYQFTPATWQAYAKEAGVNAPWGSATPDQQNEVAYKKIKQWKDQGYNPGQIASMWNAGPGKPNAYLEGNKGVNSYGVEYDTKTYAEKVARAYQRLKGQTDVPQAPVQQENPTLTDELGTSVGRAGTRLAEAVGKGVSGEINPLSSALQGVGAIAGGIGDVTSDVLHHTPVVGGLLKGAEDIVGKGVNAALDTELGQKALEGYQGFAEEHPELAGDIEAGVDIATALPILKGVSVAKKTVKGAVDTALHGAENAGLEMVKPHLTPKKMQQAIQNNGLEQRGILRETRIKDDPYDVDVYNAVKANVKGFNPSKSLLHNINATQSTVDALSKELKQRVRTEAAGRIYPFQELARTLNNLERPPLLVSDTTLNNTYDLIIAKVLEIAKKQGGSVPKLLDTRQELDSFLRKAIPNLYSSDKLTPLRQAVRDVRNAITDYTAKQLPTGFGFKEELWKQHLLLDAVENMAEKATKGSTKEIGTNALGRFRRHHPVITGLARTGTQAAIQGAGLGGVMKILD